MTYPVTACDFTPAWEPWVPSAVVGLLDGIVAADALPDMTRLGMVSDALADRGRDDAADRVRDGVRLWHAAGTLEVPTRTPGEWYYNARLRAFSGAAESGPGLVQWRRLSLYSALLIHHGPSGDDRPRLWHLYDGPYADLRVRRVLAWIWCIGLGLADRQQSTAARSTANAALSTADAAQEKHWQYARRLLWLACKAKKEELCKA